MLDDLAKLFYNTDILAIRKDQMDLDFYKALAHPKAIQKLSVEINCLTIEYFSDQILNTLETLYGSIPMMAFSHDGLFL